MAAAGDGSATSGKQDAIEQVLRANFILSVAVTQAMLPLPHKSPSARFVNVSSGLGSLTKNTDASFAVAASSYFGYCASKAALNMFTVHLAHQMRDMAIKVNSSAPGYTATDLNFHRGTRRFRKAPRKPSGSRCSPTTDLPAVSPRPSVLFRGRVPPRSPSRYSTAPHSLSSATVLLWLSPPNSSAYPKGVHSTISPGRS
jgi:NAD(P)-dependent dehydrogenase (short-subunit alcohol dehydrogenase family)